MLQQNVAMLELLGAELASKRGLLATIEPQVATQRLLLQVDFPAFGAAVAHTFVIEHPQLLVLLEGGGVEDHQAYNQGGCKCSWLAKWDGGIYNTYKATASRVRMGQK